MCGPARLFILVLLLVAFPGVAIGGATSPKIALSSAEGLITDGARSARLEGNFDFENAVQTGYGLHILVYQGTQFARYPVSDAPVTGTSSTLADGVLDEGEVAGFLLDGAAAAAGVRMVRFTPTRALVALPTGIGAGQATALIVAVTNEGVVFSNPLDFTLP